MARGGAMVAAADAGAGAGVAPGYSSEITFTVVMSCLMAASGGLIFGYDISITRVMKKDAYVPKDQVSQRYSMHGSRKETRRDVEYASVMISSYAKHAHFSGVTISHCGPLTLLIRQPPAISPADATTVMKDTNHT
ncbi:hypothetical protein OsJ_07225 [Oryza sativa Japonica Group]|uniref:Major facilitator superfamily (MFS) profile domain-containing protein n=1 Tax=Oryza sativa subsp. japonica TaxID=39947 RepID=B9F0P5_ORYSJ|nr:hypothetical protein OsJ_07225 [Oryza sativa Japonica Group]